MPDHRAPIRKLICKVLLSIMYGIRVLTFPTQIDRLLFDQVVLFAALLSPAISLLPYYIQVLIVTTPMHGDSRVITVHENSSPILVARVTIFSWRRYGTTQFREEE